MGEQIVVRIAADGTVHAETVGMQGKRCLDFVGILEDLLEASAVESRTTADYDRSLRVDVDVVQHLENKEQ